MTKNNSESVQKVNKGGRPRKFVEPSRPITVTLAERTLRLLESIDSDRAKAITKATDATVPTHSKETSSVRLVEVEKNLALIVVGPSAYLKSIPWLRLVEISPTNFILVLPSGVPVEQLELAITDLIESVTDMIDYEKTLLSKLHKHLSLLRRENKMRKSEIIFVDTKK